MHPDTVAGGGTLVPILRLPIDTSVSPWHDRAMKSEPPVTEADLRKALNLAGSPEKAAVTLGKSRRTIYRWMAHYGIERRPTFQRAA